MIITDTVGFIRDLPEELLKAFMATLEELQEADLLVHVIDVSNPSYREHMRIVDTLLAELELSDIQCLKVFNKIDCVEDPVNVRLDVVREGVVISAVDKSTLGPFLEEAQNMMSKSLGWIS